MVFICFPKDETDEETSLRRKYDKLKRKKASLTQLKSTKPEPQVVHSTLTLNKNPSQVGAKDAKKVIEKLKRSGALPQIKLPERRPVGSGFKRKIPGSVAVSSETISPINPFPSSNPVNKPTQRLFKPPSRAPNMNAPSGQNKAGDGKVEQKWSAIAGRKDDGSASIDLDLKRELVSYDDDIF